MFVEHSSSILMNSTATPTWKLITPFSLVLKWRVVNNALGNTVKDD